MKILKLKSILFSLMTIVMITVFLTSCEHDLIPPDLNNSEQVEDKNQHIAALNIDNLPSKEITLSDESGSNNVTFRIATENEEVLALYTDKTFEVDFSEVTNENSSIQAFPDANPPNELLDNPSEEGIDVFFQIAGLELRSDNMKFSISTNAEFEIALRHHNIHNWYHMGYGGKGIRIICTGRGIDGLSAYAYNTGYHPELCRYPERYHFASRYFHNQNSSSQSFWRSQGECLWVKVVGYRNHIREYF